MGEEQDAAAGAARPAPLTGGDRVARRRVFDEHAALYAAHRPTYPEALFQALHDEAGLSTGSRVLEVAPGTGQATRPLGLRGYRVTAVELGAQMAEHARRHVADLPDVTVVTSAFEDWPLPEQPFDAVFCATAWHWLDPRAGSSRPARRCARAGRWRWCDALRQRRQRRALRRPRAPVRRGRVLRGLGSAPQRAPAGALHR